MPYAFWISVLCEAFHCVPSQAEREMERCGPGWLEEVLEARQYAEAFHMVMNAQSRSDVPSSPIVDLVRKIDMERAAAAYAKKQEAANG